MKLNTKTKQLIKRAKLNDEEISYLILNELNNCNEEIDLTSLLESANSEIKKKVEKVFYSLNYQTGEILTKFPLMEMEILQPIGSKEVTKRVQEYRDVFKGLRPGSMGDKKACITKLTKWLNENRNHTIDDVIKAAKYYIKTLDGTYTYLQQADYFIVKNGQSRLSSMIDEVEGDNIKEAITFRKVI